MGKFCPPLFHYMPFRSKMANLYFITSVAILCATFYGIGIWQHSGGITPIISPVHLLSPPCTTNFTTSLGVGTAKDQNSAFAAVNNIITLDFEAHHAADHLIPSAASEIHFPPCDAKFSEYTPCEDVARSWKFNRDRNIYRERHCPKLEERLRCRIPAPHGYKVPFRWPESRDVAWFANVPHKELTVEKKNQNWVKYEGDRFYFPGGGTMFPNGANAYIDDIGKMINLRDGSIRTAIDTGCGVASWGSYLLSRNILTMSFAPRDSHEAQVQFALERGVPALIGVFASKRLPYPARAFDMAHCSRCLIPWAQYDGEFLMEVDRVLRPGGYWILSGPPINWERHWKGWQRTSDDLKGEQDKIEGIARSLCWKKLKQRGDIVVWQKPNNHGRCKANRKMFEFPPFCTAQDPDRAWYTPMDRCLHPLPKVSDYKDKAGGALPNWPERLTSVPPRISSGSLEGVTAKAFREDTEIWKKRVAYYKLVDNQLATKGRYRNLLDMNSYLAGFAAAMANDPVWVMNVVPVEANVNTLGAIYERGLIGTYQNWCEAMSSYPRTYDFIHVDSVFTLYSGRCDTEDILLEMDRILRPEGSVIIRDDIDTLGKVKTMLDAMQYESRIADHERGPLERQKILWAKKQYWTAPPRQEGTNTAS